MVGEFKQNPLGASSLPPSTSVHRKKPRLVLPRPVASQESPWRWLGISALVVVLLVGLIACKPAVNSPKNGVSHSESSLLKAVKTRGVLEAGVKFDSKPFGYLDTDGKVKGYDIDLLRELARRILGREDAVEFQQVLSSTRILAIESGNVDVVAATMTITPGREELIDFSAPYYTAGQGILVAMTSPVRQLKDLEGKRILFVMGSTSEHNIKALLPNAHYIGFKTATDAFAALKAGRGDALTTDDVILAGLSASDQNAYRLLNKRLSQEPYGLGFKQDPSTQSLRLAINKAIEAMRQDGTLARLNAKWIGLSSAH